MKPIKDEPDYLQRLINTRDNIIELCTDLQMHPTSDLGESIKIALKNIEEEIKQIELLRRF